MFGMERAVMYTQRAEVFSANMNGFVRVNIKERTATLQKDSKINTVRLIQRRQMLSCDRQEHQKVEGVGGVLHNAADASHEMKSGGFKASHTTKRFWGRGRPTRCKAAVSEQNGPDVPGSTQRRTFWGAALERGTPDPTPRMP